MHHNHALTNIDDDAAPPIQANPIQRLYFTEINMSVTTQLLWNRFGVMTSRKTQDNPPSSWQTKQNPNKRLVIVLR